MVGAWGTRGINLENGIWRSPTRGKFCLDSITFITISTFNHCHLFLHSPPTLTKNHPHSPSSPKEEDTDLSFPFLGPRFRKVCVGASA